MILTIEALGMGRVTGTMEVLTMKIGTGPTMSIRGAIHDKNQSQKSKLSTRKIKRLFGFD
jgi:hypothetical protein